MEATGELHCGTDAAAGPARGGLPRGADTVVPGRPVRTTKGYVGGRSAHEMSDAAIQALREEHGAMLAGVEGGLGVARVAVTAAGTRRALDGAAALRGHQARAGRTVAMLDRVVLDDEPPLPGELPLLRAALDTLVMLFRIGERL